MISDIVSRHPLPIARELRLIVTGGGTGSHTYTALTAVRALRVRAAAAGRTLDLLWIGRAHSLEASVAADEGIPFESVTTGKILRSGNWLTMASPANLRAMSRVPRGVLQARRLITRFRPDVVLATGGYVSVPVGLAARTRGRPLVIHEQTVRLGRANRALARRATRIAVSTPSSVPLLPPGTRSAAVVTGNPVRPELLAGQAHKAVTGLTLYGFDLDLPTIYVTGGSQGDRQINELVLDLLPWLLAQANVIHQCGPDNLHHLQQRVPALSREFADRYLLTGFIGPELPDVLALADLVISRSGAGTIAELTALGLPSLLVPLVTDAGDEQVHNAQHLHDAGAAVALPSDAGPETLRTALGRLLAEPDRRAFMAHRARTSGRPDAGDRLVDVLLAAADEGRFRRRGR